MTAAPPAEAPARSTRRGSATLFGAHFDLDDLVADGTNDTCSACPGEGVIPAGDQVWWKPSFDLFDDCDPLCRRCAFTQVRWPASYVAGIRRSRPWTGLELQVARR
jgi:hypothetical protein